MYLPKHFEPADRQYLVSLMAQHPLGCLVAQTPQGMIANHVPFEFDASQGPHGTLRAHIAKANPLWQEHLLGTSALVIFQGVQSYISPNWYPTKLQTGKMVPTWAYTVVHASGTMRFKHDPSWLKALLERLTATHEQNYLQKPGSTGKAWRLTDAPVAYIDQLLGAIVGIEIELTQLIGKWKLEQNKHVVDRAGVVSGLRALGDDASQTLATLVDEKK